MRRTFFELFGIRNLSQEVTEKVISEVELGEVSERAEILHSSFVIKNADLRMDQEDRYQKYLKPAILSLVNLCNKYPRVIVEAMPCDSLLAFKCGQDKYLHEGDTIPVLITVSYLHEGENINGTGHLVALEILIEVFNETT